MKRLVDPFNFTKFDRNQAELEAMILFSIMVANKRADQTYAKFERLMGYPPEGSPFEKIKAWLERGIVLTRLKQVRTGQYKRIKNAFCEVLQLDLRSCTVADLEAVTGIGPKTARMFLLHSRPDQRLAVLDTHILAFLREEGVSEVPRSTPPTGRHYKRLEEAFLAHCDQHGHDPATLDLAVWEQRTKSRVADGAPR